MIKTQQAAEELGIQYSTAKTIVRIYQKEGRTKKKERITYFHKDMPLSTKRHYCPTIDEGEAYKMLQIVLAAAKAGPRPGTNVFCPGSRLPSGFWIERLTEHFTMEYAAPKLPTTENELKAAQKEYLILCQLWRQSQVCMEMEGIYLLSRQTSIHPYQVISDQLYPQLVNPFDVYMIQYRITQSYIHQSAFYKQQSLQRLRANSFLLNAKRIQGELSLLEVMGSVSDKYTCKGVSAKTSVRSIIQYMNRLPLCDNYAQGPIYLTSLTNKRFNLSHGTRQIARNLHIQLILKQMSFNSPLPVFVVQTDSSSDNTMSNSKALTSPNRKPVRRAYRPTSDTLRAQLVKEIIGSNLTIVEVLIPVAQLLGGQGFRSEILNRQDYSENIQERRPDQEEKETGM
eukprot:TRINITY_DN344_c0_g1_i2.p1 TRINITY_DN344_c0_g1~~TRINITY_DN344_c0_g1_i2.p1  ORF type:complete len:398 (+),score=-37.50 TRINITY_DN344_c0_g1_i2:592-1785(+)